LSKLVPTIPLESIVNALFCHIKEERSMIFDIDRKTVEQWFNSWDLDGVNSLSIVSGRGVKTRLKGFEKVIK